MNAIAASVLAELRDLLRGRSRSTVPQPGTGAADLWLAAIFLAVALLLYGLLAVRLAQGAFLDYWNLGFDFDPARMVQTLAMADPDPYGFKHPLILLWRPLAWPFLAIGMTAKVAAAMVMALLGAGTVSMTYLLFRTSAIGRAEAAALTVLFMVTGSQIFTSLIVDTYGPASFTIAFVWLVAACRLADSARCRRLRYLAALMAFGTTITNVVQPAIAEVLVRWRESGLRAALGRSIAFGIVLALLAGLVVLIVWHADLWTAAHDPILSLKHIYWLRTKGERTGIGQVLLTFFGFSFVSPDYSWLMLPEGINMRDFRDYAFHSTGAVAMPFWLAFWTVGTVAGFAHRQYRWLAAGVAGVLAFNVLLHLDYQFRGSLYLYCAHSHLPAFILGAGLAPWVAGTRLPRRIYIAVVLLLAVLVGIDNLTVASAFVTDFDTVNIPNCPPPCAGGPQ